MKVLVVDDEPDVQLLFEQRFRREVQAGEIHFSFALSAEKALVYLDQHASECVLILSDINMPGMSGLELLRHIRQTHPLAPPTIMMITAYGDMDTHTKAIQHGADDFLTKPLDFKTLKEKFRSIYEGQGSGRG